MRRRDFIKRVVPVTALRFFIDGFRLRAYGRSPFLETLIGAATATDRVLVLVQLNGGNDGINTVIPLDQYSTYANVRSNIAIPEASVLRLDPSGRTGLHPAMTGMKSLYDDAMVTIVQGVTYPNPNLSHFRATDIWLTASDYNQYLSSGWMGRYLDYEFPDYPDGYPNEVMPDPLAIQIGSVISLGLQGAGRTMGIAIQDPQTFHQLVSSGSSGGTDTPPQTPAGHELTYIRQVALQSQAYATQVKAAADRVTRQSTYPSGNSLADQLRIVARLIAGGSKTRIYIVNIGGFDNHSSQVVGSSPTTGTHATLLGRLSAAALAFQDDLRLLGVEDRVVGMTFSEFGRRIASNASLGTDHGTAAPIFLFGKRIKPGIVGVNPSLTDLTSGNLKMQFDFRQVYASVLSQWFGVNQAELNAALQTPVLPNIQPLDLLEAPITEVARDEDLPTGYRLYENYPNPFNPTTTISYDLPNDADVVLKVYDMLGREVTTLVEDRQAVGRHRVLFDASNLSSGAYIYHLQAGSFTDRRKMLMLK